jgi:DNA-binding response OmpR family regulator
MRLLVVDDDIMLADLLESLLLAQGHEVCGTTTNVAEAVALTRLHRPDIVVLDMKLRGGELGCDIVHELAASGDLNGVGILYISGGVEFVHPRAFIGHACLHKPYRATELAAALAIVRNILGGCTVTSALPNGMRLLSLR